MSERRWALFDPETGRQIGKSTGDRERAMRKQQELGDRGPGSKPIVVRHGDRDERQDLKREKVR